MSYAKVALRGGVDAVVVPDLVGRPPVVGVGRVGDLGLEERTVGVGPDGASPLASDQLVVCQRFWEPSMAHPVTTD